jgi:hypothetical protein
MTVRPLIEQYQAMSLSIEELQKDRDNILQEYADLNCPLKVGDTVEILGYSHHGKNGIIKSVRAKYDSWDKTFEWIVKGCVLKKDGTEGAQYFDFDQRQYERWLKKESGK